MENIGEVALYIKGKVPTTYTVLGLDYGGRGIKGREAYLYSDGIYSNMENLVLRASGS